MSLEPVNKPKYKPAGWLIYTVLVILIVGVLAAITLKFFHPFNTNNAPTATINVVGSSSSVAPGQSVTLQLAGKDADQGDSVQKLELLDNDVRVSEIAGATGLVQSRALTAGTHKFTARATDTHGATSLSATALVTAQTTNTGGAIPLFKIAGQSNAQGLTRRSDLFTATLNTVSPSFTRQFSTRIWNPTVGALQKLQVGKPGSTGAGGGNELGNQSSEHPSDYEDGFGPEIGFAQRLEQEGIYNAVLAKYGRGYSTISRWQKSAGDLYPNLRNTIMSARAAIVAAGGTPDEKGFYWDQWETDAAHNSITYQADLQQFYNDLKADGLVGANEKFIICAAQDSAMLTQQRAFVKANAAAVLLTPAKVAYIPNDKLHYNARTQLAIGGNSLYNILFNSTDSINIPRLQR